MTITAARDIARDYLRHTQGVIRRLPHVDRVGIEERAAQLGRRSIKTTAKQQGIRLAVSMVDLTTLEGSDTYGKVRHLCAKAVCPAPTMPEIPSVAAVCVYPSLVGVACEALEGTGVRAASVSTAFPSGHASMLAMEAGADFIKTSTGKASSGATPGVVLVMLEAIRDYVDRTGRVVGMKAAGGVSVSKAALHMLVLVKETLGDEWLTPDRFRIGASSLLNDLLMQYQKTKTGRYARREDFSLE